MEHVIMVRWEGDKDWQTIECTPEEFAEFKSLVDAADECVGMEGEPQVNRSEGRTCVCGCGEIRYR